MGLHEENIGVKKEISRFYVIWVMLANPPCTWPAWAANYEVWALASWNR